MLRDFAKHLHWGPADVLDHQTWAEFFALWCGGDGRQGGHDPDRLRAQINRRRIAKGLKPMAPKKE